MATDVTGRSEEYWVELTATEQGTRRDWASRRSLKKLPELTLMVHKWKEVEALEKGSVTATLTLHDVDTVEEAGAAGGSDAPFARMQVTLTKTTTGIAAAVPARKEVLDRGLADYYKRQAALADFAVRVGKRRLFFRFGRADLHDELADGTFEVGFTLEEGDRVYRALPPKVSPSYVVVGDPIEDMLSLPDRFSDPARRPSLPASEAPRRHEPETLRLLEAARVGGQVDVDVDGLRFDALLDGTMTRRQLIESMLRAGGPAMTCKVRELFRDDQDPKLKGKVLDSEWTSGDIVKAYFVVHDIGILSNNRTEQHYRPSNQRIRWGSGDRPKSVHGFLNWGGVYAPGWNFWNARYGTKASFHQGNPPWSAFTIEVETVPLPYYRVGPADRAALAQALGEADPARQPADWLPEREEGGPDGRPVAFASLTWKHPIGWNSREREARRAGPKKGEVAFFVAAAPVTLIDGLVDLYLLASARAGHLLTITTHMEVDRTIKGAHDDPSGLDLQVIYDAITARLSKGGARRLPGLGGLAIPKGARYGMHPRRLTAEPVLWRGVPLSRLHSGSGKATFTTFFPQQSTPPTLRD
ncbi:MAG: hypothetical protein M9894_26420 [Planctomycetes bacterium]|nr:hypothetical protein [Planctomycetota bacterium]